jgi:hypothetical protein
MNERNKKQLGIFPRQERGTIVETILRSDLDIFIGDDAYNGNGDLIDNFVTLYTTEDEIGGFWSTYIAIDKRKAIKGAANGR